MSIDDYNENASISEEQNSIRLNHHYGAADIEEKILIAQELSIPDKSFGEHPLSEQESDSMKASSNVVDSSYRQDDYNDIANKFSILSMI